MSTITIDRKQIGSTFKHYADQDQLFVSSDGNVFLGTDKGERFCKEHSKRVGAEFAKITRKDFEKGAKEVEVSVFKRKAEGKIIDPKSKKKEAKSDWKESPWKEMVEFAKSEGLEVTTKMNQGKDTLIEEIETFLAAKELGANNTTNHIEE